jgi:hypothetical protein
MKFKDKLKNASIDTRQFYGMGIICFLVVAVTSIYTGIVTWTFMDFGSKISTIFRIVFNFGIVLFFNYLKQQLPPKEIEKFNPDIESLIKKSNL